MIQRSPTAAQIYSFTDRDSTTMKLFNLPNTLGLVSFFCALSSAGGITFGEFPSQVKVGEWYTVEYSSDRKYVRSLASYGMIL